MIDIEKCGWRQSDGICSYEDHAGFYGDQCLFEKLDECPVHNDAIIISSMLSFNKCSWGEVDRDGEVMCKGGNGGLSQVLHYCTHLDPPQERCPHFKRRGLI